MLNDLFRGVDSIGGFFKRLGLVILTIILGLAYIVGIGELTFKIISRNSKEYIILSTSILNFIVLMLIPVLVLLIVFIYFKFKNDVTHPLEYTSVYSGIYKKNKSGKAGYNLMFGILFIILLGVYLYGINNYYAVFKDRIEKHNLLSSREKTYSYKDIDEISIYVKELRSGGSLHYKVKFKDGYKIDLGHFSSAYDLVEINEIMKNNNVKVTIDKKHFNELVEDLDKQYAEPYEKIFEE